MSFLNCRFQYGQFHVRSVSNSSGIVDALADFETGDVSLGSRFSSEEYNGFTDGTTLTANAASSATVLTVASSTGMSASDRVFVELDIDTFFGTTIATVDSGTQITVDDGLSSAAASTNRVVIISQLASSTTGTITEDFKATKVDTIFNKSVQLEETGFTHSDRNFFLGVKDGSDDMRFMIDYNRLRAERAAGTTMSTEATIDFDLVPYSFVSNGDYDTFIGAQRTRILAIYGGGSGESGLISDVTEDANTQAAMDAITDTRT